MDGEIIWPGRPYPLGATPDAHGTNFAVYARHAERVDLCLFDPADPSREVRRAPLREQTGHVFHALPPGDRRRGRSTASAPTAPTSRSGASASTRPSSSSTRTRGPSTGEVDFERPGLRLPARRAGGRTSSADDRDSAPGDAEGRGGGGPLRLGRRSPPGRPVAPLGHLRGAREGLHRAPPGRAAGAARHLRSASRSRPPSTTSRSSGSPRWSCSPSTSAWTSRSSRARGLTNYWGYSTLGYFAPEQRYARGRRGEQVTEFKRDGEGAARRRASRSSSTSSTTTPARATTSGPTLSLKGLDNRELLPARRGPARATTGTPPAAGTASTSTDPQTLKLVMDSLRYWVEEMHVDGFRFDLAVDARARPRPPSTATRASSTPSTRTRCSSG